MSQRYYWIQATVPESEWEILSWQLFEAGAPAIEELDAPLGQIQFRINLDTPELKEFILSEFSQIQWEQGSEENQDWDMHWRMRQKPVQVSENLQVCPPWVEPENRPGQVVLHIEAKMAFGTGEHESTRLCAQLMESQIKREACQRLLDIGSGTGVLAMYALKLGVQSAFLTEIDPVCIPCQVENYELNGLGSPIGILGALESIRPNAHFDLVVCNMIRSEIWPLRLEMVRLLAKNGKMILSGQLAKEDHYIRDWFNQAGITILEERVEGEWWAVCGQKK